VEQHAHKVLKLTDCALILDRGTVAWAGSSDDLRMAPAAMERYLGVSG